MPVMMKIGLTMDQKIKILELAVKSVGERHDVSAMDVTERRYFNFISLLRKETE